MRALLERAGLENVRIIAETGAAYHQGATQRACYSPPSLRREEQRPEMAQARAPLAQAVKPQPLILPRTANGDISPLCSNQGRVSCRKIRTRTATTSPAFEVTSKRRKSYPSETAVKRGHRTVHGGVELREKLGRNDPCPCGSGRRFQALLHDTQTL